MTMQRPVIDQPVLVLDAQTRSDLELFASDPEAPSLFNFCNRTSSAGGANVLEQRMMAPFSDRSAIRSTQAAITFINSHRENFDALHGLAYSCGRVEQYAHEILPVVAAGNVIEFAAHAAALWFNHERHYTSIASGVLFACRLVRALKVFVAQPALTDAAGELQDLLTRMRSLLQRPLLDDLPAGNKTLWAWRVLRLDQVFRLHEKRTLDELLKIYFELDALVAMADVTRDEGFVLPDVLEGEVRVQAEGLVHPFVPDAVANPVRLDQAQRVLFLTGPNMAGKTTYLRAFATALYFAHLGMGVPASQFSFVPAEQLFCSIALSDDLHGGVSYFRAEALRVRAVAKAIAAGRRVVAVMDEPFKGTNVKDAFDASLAVLVRFAEKPDCLFMFSSHLIELQAAMDNAAIDCRYFGALEDGEKLRFDYQLKEGVSSQRLGMRVLTEEGIFELLDN